MNDDHNEPIDSMTKEKYEQIRQPLIDKVKADLAKETENERQKRLYKEQLERERAGLA